MSISEELNKIIASKEAIRQSIIAKGTDVGTDVPFSDYANKIDEIETSSSEYENPEYYGLRTGNGVNYHRLFYNSTLVETMDLSKWDTSRVTDMEGAFELCGKLKMLNVTGWDTSKVTTMRRMFYGCASLHSLNLSNWNVSNVTNAEAMFYKCSSLTILNLSGWDTSNITTFSGSVYGFLTSCEKLEIVEGELDLSSAKEGSLSNSDTYYAFKDCTSLKKIKLKNIFKNSPVTNNAKWSINLKDTIIEDQYLLYIIEQLPDLINDKYLMDTDKIVLTLPPTNTLTAEQVQPAIDKGWTVANTNF